ncbi:MAG: carboxylesterase/lipase family protein [Bacteroidales bacterium]|nr:carboxylesterase/lipase family protein [Bacteroidales bacterium]
MKKSIIIAACAMVLASCCNQYPYSHELTVNAKDALVKTQQGTLCGYIEDGIYTFKGIKYAKAERFMAPEDPDSWEGVQTALYYGNQCCQAPRFTWKDDAEAFLYQWDDGVQSDDCQYLNVWTKGINDNKKRPVMVWLHGGGYAMGASSELPFYDGANLAKKDVVLVSINHRLNVLGFMDISDYGEKYKYSGSCGVLDMIKALEWVNKNIAGFGGDPNNVTIFGQSGGGGKVNILLDAPKAKGLFNKGIIESGSMINFQDKNVAREMGNAVVKKLGLTAETIDQIQTIPYEQLLAAATDAIVEANPTNIFYRLYGAGMWFGPQVDGEVIPFQPTDPRVAEISKGIPTIIGCNHSEGSMLESVYKNADIRLALGDTKAYLYVFAKPSPHMDGTFGTNHCTEMPYVFNNIYLGRFMVGNDKSCYKLADFMSDVWVSFAKDGNPNVKGFKWEEYNPETKPMVIFNDKTTTAHKGDQVFEDMKNLKREQWVYRQPMY